MSFGQLVPGMQPIPIPEMQPNQMMKMGMAAMQQAQARGMQQRPGGQPPQGLLQRLLNPAAPPMDLAAPGMAPNAPGGNPMQMGMLAKLFPGLAGGLGAPPMGGTPPGGMMPQVPPNVLGGLY